MRKTCTVCTKRKSLTAFQKNGRGGYRPKCKDCIKIERNPIAAKFPINEVIDSKTVRVTPVCEYCEKEVCECPNDIACDLENPAFQKLTEKYQAHCNIGWSKKGVAVLQVFTEPRLTWKGKTPEEVIGKALA